MGVLPNQVPPHLSPQTSEQSIQSIPQNMLIQNPQQQQSFMFQQYSNQNPANALGMTRILDFV